MTREMWLSFWVGWVQKYSRRFSLKVCNPTAWTPGSQPLREGAKEKHHRAQAAWLSG